MVYSADLVLPITAPRIHDGAVAVLGDRILHVGEREWVVGALRERGVEFRERHWPGILSPGLVNAHTHLQYSGMGEVALGSYDGFEDWGESFDEVYDRQGDDWGVHAATGARLAIATGTSAAADVVTDAGALDALHDANLHGIAYWEVMGWDNEGWGTHGRDRVRDEMHRIPHTPGAGVSPHAPYSLDIQPLLDIPDIVRQNGLRLHIHLAESRIERGESAPHDGWSQLGAGSFRDLRRKGIGVSSTQFVDHLGVLGPDCHIAHGVYVDEADRELLRLRGTAVALCPRSNRTIGLEMPPVAAYLQEGNQVSVGTDSLASSPSLDLMADVALLYRIARDQGYHAANLHARLFSAATLGGAAAMGFNVGPRRFGHLAVGALADLAFFDIPVTAENDGLAQLVEAGEGTCVATVIAGRVRFSAPAWDLTSEENSND
ncbi:amidohydrolase family protein [Mycetocola spongiae]|nr:amidohydrolase family protein [Mycetocola spongiae]